MAESEVTRIKHWKFKLQPHHFAVIEALVVLILVTILRFTHFSKTVLLIIGVVTLLFCVLLISQSYRKHTFFDWLRVWYKYRKRNFKNKTIEYHKIKPFDYETIGIYLEDEFVITAIELFSVPNTAMFVYNNKLNTVTNNFVPVEVLVESLYQFDITLHSIDIVSTGFRSLSASTYDSFYDSLIGASPAASQRRTIVYLRFKPQEMLDALQARGGDTKGALRSAFIATERVQRYLKEEGVYCSILKSADLNEYQKLFLKDLEVRHQHSDDPVKEDWKNIKIGTTHYATTYQIADTGWTLENQNFWWNPASIRTTQTIRLTPKGERRQDGAYLSGYVSYITLEEEVSELIETSGLRMIHGSQLPALYANMGLGKDSLALTPETVEYSLENSININQTIGPTGILLGSTNDSYAAQFYLDLNQDGGKKIGTTYHFSTPIEFLIQLVIRAISSGYKIEVNSNDWNIWRHVIQLLRSPNIWLGNESTRSDADLIIYDRIPPTTTDTKTSAIYLGVKPKNPGKTIKVYASNQDDPYKLIYDNGNNFVEFTWTIDRIEMQYLFLKDDSFSRN